MNMGRIEKLSDYFNLKNIGLLRNCNIEYGHARTQFKKARKSNRKEDWNKAFKLYDNYLKERNTIDIDAKYEITICIFMLACFEDDKNKQDQKLKESFKRLSKLTDEKENDFSFKKKLWELYTIRKEYRGFLQHYRGEPPSNNDWADFTRDQKIKQIEKIKKVLKKQ